MEIGGYWYEEDTGMRHRTVTPLLQKSKIKSNTICSNDLLDTDERIYSDEPDKRILGKQQPKKTREKNLFAKYSKPNKASVGL